MAVPALLEELFTLHGHRVTLEAPLEGRTGTIYTIPVLAESDEHALIVGGHLDGTPLTAAAVAEFAATVEDVGADLGILFHAGSCDPDAASERVVLWDRATVVRLLGEAQLAQSLGEEPPPLRLVPRAAVEADHLADLLDSTQGLPDVLAAAELPVAESAADFTAAETPVAESLADLLPSAFFEAAAPAAPLAPLEPLPEVSLDAPRPRPVEDDDLKPFPPIAPQALPVFPPPPALEEMDFLTPDHPLVGLPNMEPPVVVAPAAPYVIATPPAPQLAPVAPRVSPPAPVAPAYMAAPVAATSVSPAAPAWLGSLLPNMGPAPPRSPAPATARTPSAPATAASSRPAPQASFTMPPAFAPPMNAPPLPSPPAPPPAAPSYQATPPHSQAPPYAAPPLAAPTPPAPVRVSPLPAFPSTRQPVLPVRVSVEEAKRKVKDRLFSVRHVEVLLQPVHLFEYECDLLREGSLSFDTVDGRIQVHGSDKGAMDVDPDVTNPDAPSLLSADHPYPVESRVLRVAEDRARQLAFQHVVQKHTRNVNVRVADHNNSLYYVEKRKVEPTSEQVRLAPLGVHMRPVWRLHGANGVVDVDATDGREVMTDLRGHRTDAMIIE